MANKVIKSMNATNYSGQSEYVGANYKVAGGFSADGNKVMNNISGSVRAGEIQKANFNAYRNGGQYMYNFSDIVDVSELAAIASEVAEAVAAVNAELIPVNE